MNPIARITKIFLGHTSLVSQKPLTRHDYIELESMVGGKLFGDTPQNTTRQFFYMSNHDWFYISTVNDSRGSVTRSVIRYHVQPEGVVKSIDGKGHLFIEGEEYTTFIEATRRYLDTVARDVYKKPRQQRVATA